MFALLLALATTAAPGPGYIEAAVEGELQEGRIGYYLTIHARTQSQYHVRVFPTYDTEPKIRRHLGQAVRLKGRLELQAKYPELSELSIIEKLKPADMKPYLPPVENPYAGGDVTPIPAGKPKVKTREPVWRPTPK